jgi:hypothetical protein
MQRANTVIGKLSKYKTLDNFGTTWHLSTSCLISSNLSQQPIPGLRSLCTGQRATEVLDFTAKMSKSTVAVPPYYYY